MSESINPEGWPRPSGFSNGSLAEGRFLAIAGQIGWDERGKLVGTTLLAQAAQAMHNIVVILRAAGGMPEDLVRMTWYVTDKAAYKAASRELGAVYREIVGNVYPAMTLVQVADLLEEGAIVEIEATAVLPWT
ncbi:MAG TPA: RidA family protein [Candidatus Acidoferrales bacterium]|jgi:enamine deaminase RidA (YjgF/YER057c/UK114 family)|nr:RidA family protein [Candidatus Acidoferrales bacterium]